MKRSQAGIALLRKFGIPDFMARPVYPSDNVEKLLLRFPDGLRDRIKGAADASGRSMNSEVIQRLIRSFDEEDRRVLSVRIADDVWELLKVQSALNKQDMEECAAEIFSDLMSRDKDNATALNKIVHYWNQIGDLQDEIIKLREEIDFLFLLYCNKASQIKQLTHIIDDKFEGRIPEKIKIYIEDARDITSTELDTLKDRYKETLYRVSQKIHPAGD